MTPDDEDDPRRQLVRAVGEDVRATLSGETEPQPLAELVDEVFALAARWATTLRDGGGSDAKRRLPVCAPGCSSCCHLHAVFVTAPEALRLATHLRRARSASELARLRALVDRRANETRELSRAERGLARVPCPLLDEAGACSVHPARPLLCRGYTSCDKDACLRAFDAGDALASPPGDLGAASAHLDAFAGVLLGAARSGRDAGPYELIAALRVALDDDAELRWARGEPVFDAAGTRIEHDGRDAWDDFVAREIARTRSG